jgi:ABC-type transport system involved in cytochrome c biogenesis permease subunit
MIVEGVKLFCFGASYSVALAAEAAAAWLPPQWRRVAALGFTAAGVLAHTIYLGARALTADTPPLATSFDSLVVLAWVLAVAYSSIQWYYPRVTVGIFALPVIVGLIVLAGLLGQDSQRDLHGWARVWGPAHGAVLALGGAAVFVGFVAGMMYLVQARRLKAKQLASDAFDLPSLELLERLNRQGITAAFTLLTIGLGIGLLLAIQQGRAGDASIRLLDPKVICAGLMWLAFGFLLQVRSHPQFRGRRVALLTIVAFGLMLFTFVGVDLLLDSWHASEPVAANGTWDRKGLP